MFESFLQKFAASRFDELDTTWTARAYFYVLTDGESKALDTYRNTRHNCNEHGTSKQLPVLLFLYLKQRSE